MERKLVRRGVLFILLLGLALFITDIYRRSFVPRVLDVPIDAARSGQALDVEFSVKTKCAYWASIEFHHPKAELQKLDGVLGGLRQNKLFAPIQLAIYRLENDREVSVYDQILITEKGKGIGASNMKIFLDYIQLERGRYRARLTIFSSEPDISSIETHFLIAVSPKTVCKR